MFKVITKYQRSDVSVPFYKRGENLTTSATAAKINGQLISEEIFLSPDKLTSTYVATWDSVSSYDAFNATPEAIAYVQERDAYNDAHDITLMLKKAETISA